MLLKKKTISSLLCENNLCVYYKVEKEDNDLLFRSFLINKVNETYYKYYKSLEKNNEIPNLPFSNKLNFCLDNRLIPFLNSDNIVDKNNENLTLIIVTSDLIHELKNKIPQISSLNEVTRIIDGFEYGQKRVGGKNVRSIYGTKVQLLNFLGME